MFEKIPGGDDPIKIWPTGGRTKERGEQKRGAKGELKMKI